MCGIHLLINPIDNGRLFIEKMMAATTHRGPDYSGFSELGENVFLAGNRLKILDLSNASNQPFWSSDRNAVLVWNGALYNYQDLRNELLDLNYVFQTNSDSEVLLYWLMAFGSDRISDLRGMFAFAFADLKKRKITVARDISGEKPLYFWNSDHSWCFSSETKGVVAGSNKRFEIDQSQFIPFFYSRHTFPDKTIYREIQQVLPGHGLTISWNGEDSTPFHWDYPKAATTEYSKTTFEENLKDSVLKNFHAERPVGMVLSGGADSSLLYAMWFEETGVPLSTYTAMFETKYQKKYQDSQFAKKLTQKYPSRHHEVEIDALSVIEHWDEYVGSLDQPIGDSAGFLTWMIAKEAKSEVQVLISGAGADELFGGYNRHKAFKRLIKNPKMFAFLEKYISALPMPDSMHKLFASMDETPEKTFINFSSLMPIPKHYQSLFTAWYPKSADIFKNALEWDRTFYLVNDILKIHDTACMAHGIEGRSPYLDMELIRMSQNMTEDQHLALKSKAWIKDALDERGLAFVSKRKKLGFGLPLQEWFRHNIAFRTWVIDGIREMEKTWGKTFPEEMLNFISKPEKRMDSHYLIMWNLFLLATWLKKVNS